MEETINKYVKAFEQSISDNEEEKIELIEEFRNYLELGVQTIQNSALKYVKKDEETISKILDKEFNKIMQMDIIGKKQYLLNDEKFEEIKVISNKVFEAARLKKDGEECDYELSEIPGKLREMLKGVRGFNIESAKKIVSETLLDLDYLKKKNSKLLSLRMFRFLKAKDKGEMEEI